MQQAASRSLTQQAAVNPFVAKLCAFSPVQTLGSSSAYTAAMNQWLQLVLTGSTGHTDRAVSV